MTERLGDWMQTYPSGTQFWPLDPRPEEVHAEDVAHALSHVCRFGGHCRQFYSVAEHSVRVAMLLPPPLRLWGLLHDAAEAYLGDMVRPLKHGMPQYRDAEFNLMRCVVQRFNLSPDYCPDEVTQADEVLLATEKRDLLRPPPAPWDVPQGGCVEPLPDRIEPWLVIDAWRGFRSLLLGGLV